MHYQRWMAHGSTDKSVRGKVPIPHGTLHGYNYHRCRCRKCAEVFTDYQYKYRHAHPSKITQYNRKQGLRKYGITLEEYDRVLAAQGDGCAICGRSITDGRKRYLEVDHCHETNVVRGILCTYCNRGLGHFEDDSGRLRRAADYLERVSA